MANAIKVIRKVIKKISDKEAKEIAEEAAGASRPRLPRGGRNYGPSTKPKKIVRLTPSEIAKRDKNRMLDGTVSKTKKPDVKPSMTKKIFKDYGGGSVSPGQRAAIKAQMDKGLKPDSKVTEAKIPKTERVRPPKDKPRVFKKVIKKVTKTKPVTTPKPRTDKPVQGPAKIKRLVPKKKFKEGAKPRIGKLQPDIVVDNDPRDIIKYGIPRRSTKAEIEEIIRRRGGM